MKPLLELSEPGFWTRVGVSNPAGASVGGLCAAADICKPIESRNADRLRSMDRLPSCWLRPRPDRYVVPVTDARLSQGGIYSLDFCQGACGRWRAVRSKPAEQGDERRQEKAPHLHRDEEERRDPGARGKAR